MKVTYKLWFLAAVLAVFSFAGCGGGDDNGGSSATLVSIVVAPQNPSIAVGTAQQFSATGTYSNGLQTDITTSVTWNSSNTGVATIDNKGLVTSSTLGSTTISATLAGVSGSTTLNSEDVASIAVSPDGQTIATGATTLQFSAIGTLTGGATQDLTKFATWNSSVIGVATIDSNGLATSGSVAGSTTITADFGGQSGSASLTTDTVASIAVTPATATIPKGTQQQFKADGTLTGGATQDLTKFATWSSSDSAIADVSSTGLATALAVSPPSALITAAFGGVFGTATLTITAPTLVSIAVTPANPNIAFNTTLQFTATGTFSDTSTGDITTSVTWSSSNTSIATINSSTGLATAGNSSGSTTIKATSGTISGSTSLTVFSGQAAYVANSGSNSVSVIDTVTNKEISRITVGNVPTGVAIDSLALRAYVTNNGSNTVSVINIQNNSVVGNPIPVGNGPDGIAVNPFTKKAYVANNTSNTVSVIDTNSNTVIKTINLTSGSRPRGVALNSSASRVYVANNGSGDVSVIDTTSDAIIGTPITVAGSPIGVAIDFSLNRVYVANNNSSTVTGIDAIVVPPVVTNNIILGSGTGPWGVAVSTPANGIYVTNNGNGTVSVLDTSTNIVIAIIRVGFGPKGVAVNSSGSIAYVANSGSNTVSVIDTSTNNVVGSPIPVGSSPSGIAVAQ